VHHLTKELEQNELDTAHCECEKKKLKINEFDVNPSVVSYITPHPSTYAINKLEDFDYIELFYLCLNDICKDKLPTTPQASESEKHISRDLELPEQGRNLVRELSSALTVLVDLVIQSSSLYLTFSRIKVISCH
jgi:hypothetical protein